MPTSCGSPDYDRGFPVYAPVVGSRQVHDDQGPPIRERTEQHDAVVAHHTGDLIARQPCFNHHVGDSKPPIIGPALRHVRRVTYTTNSIEALHRQTRKIIKTRGHFPTEDAARKLIYLAITKAETRWRQVLHWHSALAAFKIHFPDRIPNTDI